MSIEIIISIIGFAFAGSGTPGPNNMMLMASGLNFGFRRTIPHILGIDIGFFTLQLAVGFGLGVVLKTAPVIFMVIKYIGIAYLLYLAWQIANAGRVKSKAQPSKPFSFMQAAFFQWVNPKAWVVTAAAMATFTNPDLYITSVLTVAVVFAIVTIPACSFWAGFGVYMQRWLKDPVRRRVFNIAMALLLVLSLWPMLKTNIGDMSHERQTFRQCECHRTIA